MSNANWTWADLTNVQLQQLTEAENTLGTDYLLVYQPGQTQAGPATDFFPGGVDVATLTPSQVECLQGLENQLHAVIVAYRKGES